MATPFKLDHDELARCAQEFRDAMLEFRKKVIGFYEQEIIDGELECLGPLIDLCINKQLEEPYYLSGAKIFDDILAVPELTKPFYEFTRLLRGGMTPEGFWKSEYYKERRVPRQLRKPPECVPSAETLRKI